MATVATSALTDVLAPPDLAAFARDSTNGNLYVVARATSADTLTLYRSTNTGGSWASYATFTHTGLQEISSLVVDKNGYAHLAYRLGTVSADSLWYRRCNLSSATWSSGLQISNADGNGGVIGSRWQGLDIAVVRNSNGTYAIYVAGVYQDTTPRHGIWTHGVSIDGSGTIYNNDGIVTNNRIWLTNGPLPGRESVALELEHTGDGFTSSNPNIWVTWGRTALQMVKLSWQGSSVGWSGPSSFQTINSLIPARDNAAGRWDGQQWVMAVTSPDDSTMVRIYQRNQANTFTTMFDTPTHPTGTIRQIALGYDVSSRNIRVYAVGTSTAVLYFVDYVRATATWSAWATVVATAILGSTAAEFGVRRGGSSGNGFMDVITAHSGAPNTIVHTAQPSSSSPNVAIWNTSAQPYLNGGAADVNATLTLDWDFSDPDPGQVQGSYALSRQIGAGALQYYTAAGGTWGGVEVQNSTATTQVTLASSWAAGSDANYTFKVKVWDSTNVPAPSYSAALIIIPSVKVNPTITAPTAAQVIANNVVTAAWTVSEQTQYRVQLNVQGGGPLVYDSNWVTSSVTSLTLPYTFLNGTAWTLTLTTKNLEGLASTAQTVNFTILYTLPPAPSLVATPIPASGVIRIVITNPAPVGSQPAFISQDLYRRVVANSVLNLNPYFEVNLTDWTQVNATGTRSTVQFHQGIASCRVVPNGVSADCYEESTAVTLDPTQAYLAEAFIRADTANKPIKVYLNWYNGASFVSAATFSLTPIATAWHYISVVAAASSVPTATKVSVAAGVGSTPAASDAVYIDEVKLSVYNPTAGVRVASGLAASSTVDDWKTTALTTYEYQASVIGANGTTINGPWMQ